MSDTGHYAASRTTGFPLYEIINVPLIRYGGWLASNTATLIVSIICVFIFGQIVLKMKSRYPEILTVIFALFPHFLANASITLDYLWALSLGLGGFLALLHRKEKWAGVLVGLSTGFRPTGIVFVVPFSLWLYVKEKSLQRIFHFALFAGLCGLAAYAPALSTYGASRLSPSSYAPTLGARLDLMVILFLYKGSQFLGTPATIFLLVLFFHLLVKRKLFLRRDVSLLFWSAALAFLFPFFFYCDEPAYLLPVFPFLLIFLDQAVSRKALVLFLVLCLSYNFFNIDRYSKEDLDARPLREEGLSVVKGIRISFIRGVYAEEHFQRKVILALRNKLPKMKLGEKAVVLLNMENGLPLHFANRDIESPEQESGDRVPFRTVKAFIGKSRFEDTYFFELMGKDDFQKVMRVSENIYYLEKARRMLIVWEGYDVEAYGARRINLEELFQ